MATWIVTSEYSSVCADGAEWLDALASALPHFEFSRGMLDHLTSAVRADGTVDVFGPGPKLWLRVAPFLNAVDMFARCAPIYGAPDVAAAATIALDLVRAEVPADAGAVLLATHEASQLEFVSAFGPRAGRVLGTFMPVESGLAGFVTSFPTGTIVYRVQGDCRFYGAVDRASGYHTESILAVPIITRDSPCFGCLELLNPPDRFHARDLPMAQTIAAALAAWLLVADN